MKKISIGALAFSSTLLSPIAAYAETEVHFWHAFTGRLGELVAAQVKTSMQAKTITLWFNPTKATIQKL